MNRIRKCIGALNRKKPLKRSRVASSPQIINRSTEARWMAEGRKPRNEIVVADRW